MPNISLTSLGTAYTESFNTLSDIAGSTTNDLTIAGWVLTESGGGARDNEQYAVDTGASNAGDTFSYGTAGSTERALGGLLSGTLIPLVGVFFDNNTGSTITSLTIAYTGEEWRLGTASRTDQLDFQYSLDATSLTTGTWQDWNPLDFITPNTVDPIGAKDGNASGFSTNLSSTISSLSIANGATFALRWSDFNASGADDGLAIDDFSLTAQSDVVAPTLSISDASVAEGDGGTTILTFTVSLGSPAPAGGVTFDIATADGTAQDDNPASEDNDYVARSLAGQTIPEGSTTYTFDVTVNGDAATEPNETFFVNVTNITGATAGDTQGQGIITNDDLVITPIHAIQGSGLKSALVEQILTTRGIVTAVDTNGFFIQDATGDGDSATSDGIFVFTNSAPPVAVGALVNVSGMVLEFTSGTEPGSLSLTELTGSITVTQLSSGNPLPTAIVIGTGGLNPPTSDLAAGINFFEALEGMRVTVLSPQVTGPTNSFGEIFTVASNGANATGVNGRGDILISGGAVSFGNTNTVGGDFNPERIQIDPGLGQSTPNVNVGARLVDVNGIVNYSFGNYEVLATSSVTIANASPLVKTGTTLTGDTTHILVASYNAENLDPGDGAARFNTIASEIINRLNGPDIVALQEIQDNNGATNDSVTAANQTLQMIVDAISSAGGPTYAFIDNPFIGDDANGGEPGGNIRTAFLYRTDHVGFVAGSLRTVGADGSAISAGPDLSQQTDLDNPFFASRPPLVADFTFNGVTVTVVDNHFSSQGGSAVLMGSIQPPTNGAEVRRAAQAQAVNTFVDGMLGADINARVIVTGDLNENEFEEPLAVLKGTASISNFNGTNGTASYTPGGSAILTDLQDMLPADQRFNYVFDGNAQTLDHMLATGKLATGAQFQPVHINAEFIDQTSDHDPLVGLFVMDAATPAANVAPVNIVPATQNIEANTATAIGGLSVADPDSAGAAITTTLSVAHGTLTVASAGGAAVSGSGTASVTITGTVAAINTTLSAANNVVYKGAHDFVGTDTLAVLTNDNGNTGAGGPLTDTDSVTLNISTLITGTTGNDSYNALPGQERIDALGGIDTITFGFRLVDTSVTYESNKVIIDGPSGSHTVLTGFEVFSFTDGTVHNDDATLLVDDLFYYSKYHDVWNAHVDADAHFLSFGRNEGRDPSFFFSTVVYRSANPDVAASGVSLLDHFDASGWLEGRLPSIHFDPVQYLAANPDVAAAHVDPLRHYLQFGYQEGRVPFAPTELVAQNGFDYVYYLNHNPDVAASGIDPFQHFQTVGWQEGRNPNALFDTNGYLATYTDVHTNPLDHYNQFGWHEGRDPSVGFDTTSYLGAYADVNAANVNPLTHFLHFGIHEGRAPFSDGVWG